MRRLRLVKVRVQPVFQYDDGENLTEVIYGDGGTSHPVAEIPASEWPDYSAGRFAEEVAEWQKRLDAEDVAELATTNGHG